MVTRSKQQAQAALIYTFNGTSCHCFVIPGFPVTLRGTRFPGSRRGWSQERPQTPGRGRFRERLTHTHTLTEARSLTCTQTHVCTHAVHKSAHRQAHTTNMHTHAYTAHTDIHTVMCAHTCTHRQTHRCTHSHRHTDMTTHKLTQAGTPTPPIICHTDTHVHIGMPGAHGHTRT